jgi:hypothetical protein
VGGAGGSEVRAPRSAAVQTVTPGASPVMPCGCCMLHLLPNQGRKKVVADPVGLFGPSRPADFAGWGWPIAILRRAVEVGGVVTS